MGDGWGFLFCLLSARCSPDAGFAVFADVRLYGVWGGRGGDGGDVSVCRKRKETKPVRISAVCGIISMRGVRVPLHPWGGGGGGCAVGAADSVVPSSAVTRRKNKRASTQP